jgi:subtilisin family serine protease
MLKVRYGGKQGKPFSLTVSPDSVVVRTHSGLPLDQSPLSKQARQLVGQMKTVVRYPEAGVEILRATEARQGRSLRDKVRTALKREKDSRFAGRVLCDPKTKAPILYTENFFVKFDDDYSPTLAKRLIKQLGLTLKQELEYARNAYFLEAPERTGQKVFSLAEKLLQDTHVELCHPELIREARSKTAFPQQWHLKDVTLNGHTISAHAHVEAAWNMSQGEGITIAIIDDGVDMDHEEFRSPGKIVAPRDVTRKTDNPRPGGSNNHGTACAGVACADGNHGASGVAPRARLLPIRLASGLGSQAEADAFIWAAKNGADVISCSWGPPDGQWWNEQDPRHNKLVPLPDSTRLALDWATTHGRNGKGCVITWAAGNGNESVDNDGYASYPNVIAVAACNDRGSKSVYSDVGKANWCAFPSNDFQNNKTSGIWTTDRTGNSGYNLGQPTKGDPEGHYTNSFGGTSSACPGVAGVAALVLSRNPNLRWDQVKEILRESCDKIDKQKGQYNPQGRSPLYGYGRVNAKTAVTLALPPQPAYTSVHTALQDIPIHDLKTSRISVAVGETKPAKEIKIAVEIDHTYIGDLEVRINPPSAMNVGSIRLFNQTGGATQNLKQAFDSVNTSALVDVARKNPQGTWTLEVTDHAKQDTGLIRGFSVELIY